MAELRVLLLGMTGFGNNALDALARLPFVSIVGVFTPDRPDMPFPYYECPPLQEVAEGRGLPLFEGRRLSSPETCRLVLDLAPDLIVVSSFDQIVPREIIDAPGLGVINVHPSLLPKYRGATPTFWALMAGEEKTGVTVHFIEDERLDRGRIVAQAGLEIEADDNDGVLRRKLGRLSEDVLKEAINLVRSRDRETFPMPDEKAATYYPKRTMKEAEIDLTEPFTKIINRIRAVQPYPGAFLKIEGRTYKVHQVWLLDKGTALRPSGTEGEGLVVVSGDGKLRIEMRMEKEGFHDRQ